MLKFSVMLLTHNRLDDLSRCIRSLAGTIKRKDTEILIWDNASDPDVKRYLRRIQGVRLWLSDQNLGVSGGRKKLLEQVRGDVLIFLDSDVEIADKNWLENLAECLKPENVGLAGPAGSFIPANFNGFLPAPMGECDVVSGWCQAFKRICVDAGASIDTQYGMFWEEDSDFCLQIRSQGWDVVCSGYVGVDHQAGASGDTGQRSRNMQRFKDKWRGKGWIKAEGGY